ncbi:MAG: hypothetical protein ABI760_11110, partial [Ferruginibacter sp.]
MTGLSFEELKDKNKDELDRIKLAQEISVFKETKDFERKKFSGETFRLIIIAALSAFISLLSLGTSIWMKYLDKTTSQTDEVRKHIDNLKDKFYQSNNRIDQNKIACQISVERNPNNDKDIAKDILDFKGKCDTLTQIVSNYTIATDTINSAIAGALKTDTTKKENKFVISKSDKADDVLIQLQNQKIASTSETQRQALVKQADQYTQSFINSIPDSLIQLKSAVRLTDTINNNVMKQLNVTSAGSNPTSDNKTVIKDYGILWFKAGYFLQFDDMRVLLQYLDKGMGIQVQICNIKSSGPCPNPIRTKEWISFDKPMNVRVG